MGRLLEEYIANSVPALQAIVEPEVQYMERVSERRGQQQPEGATTFPLSPEQPIQGQPIGPGGAPTGPMAALPGPGGINPAAAATPTFEAPAPAAGGRAMSPIPVSSQITTESGQISPDYLQIKVPY